MGGPPSVIHTVCMSSTKAAQAEATRRALLRAGRKLFERRGFGGTSQDDLVAAAGLTRGALYHHFDGALIDGAMLVARSPGRAVRRRVEATSLSVLRALLR